jgi:hypothetical protein
MAGIRKRTEKKLSLHASTQCVYVRDRGGKRVVIMELGQESAPWPMLDRSREHYRP